MKFDIQKVKKEFDSINFFQSEAIDKSNVKIENCEISPLIDKLGDFEKLIRSLDFWKIENENLKVDELDWYLRFTSNCSNEEFFDLELRTKSAPYALKSLVQPRFQADLENFFKYIKNERELNCLSQNIVSIDDSDYSIF